MKLVFREIWVTGWHGFTAPISLKDLTPGLNVVYAGNARGKSTLATAALIALGGVDRANKKEKILPGQIRCRVDREGASAIDWSSPDPGLLGPDQAPALYFGEIRELIRDELTEESVSALRSLIGSLQQPEKARKARPNSREISHALAELNKKAAEDSSLAKEEREIGELEALLAESRKAEAEIGALEQWLVADKLRRQIQELEAAQSQDLADNPGIELQTASSDSDLAGRINDLNVALRTASDSEAELARVNPSGSLLERPLTTEEDLYLKSLVRRESELETSVRESDRTVRELTAELARQRERLAALLDPEPNLDEWKACCDAWERWLELADRRREEEAKARGLIGAKAAWEQGTAEQPATDADLDWRIRAALSATEKVGPDLRPVIFLVLALVGGGAAIFLPELWQRGAAIGIALMAGILVHLLLKPQTDSSEKDAAQKDLPPELRGKTLAQLLDAWRKSVGSAEAAAARTLIASRLEALTQPGEPLPEPPEWLLGQEYRLAPALKLLSELLVKEGALAGAAEQLETLKTELSQIRGEGRRLTNSAGLEAETESLETLATLMGQWDRASANLRRAKDEVQRRQMLVQEQLLTLGFVPGTDAEDALSTLKSRRELANSLIRRKSDLLGHRATLEGLARFEEKVSTMLEDPTAEAVEAAIEVRRERISKEDDWQARLDDLRGKVRAAEEGGSLTKIRSTLDQKLLEYGKAVDDWQSGMVAEMLDSHLRKVVKSDYAPEVVQLANKWLARFTKNRYRLEIADEAAREDGLGGLVVQDDILRARPYQLLALSSGTKLHTALAIRLATIEQNELRTGLKAPLLLDEIHAVSDREAREAIATALHEVAAARQVIVFTNHEEDVKLLGLEPTPIHGAERERPIEPQFGMFTPEDELVVGPGVFDRRIPVEKQLALIHLEDGKEWGGLAEAMEDVRLRLNQDFPLMTMDDLLKHKPRALTELSEAERFYEQSMGKARIFVILAEEVPAYKSWVKKVRDSDFHWPMPSLQEVERRLKEAAGPLLSPKDVAYGARVLHDSL